jgi:hypothetical protein
VTHAADIVVHIPQNKTSSHELGLIGWAFTSIDDLKNAESFFLKSIARAANNTEKILSERNYARFTFQKLDIKRADEKFNEIMKKYNDPKDDIITYYRGETYKRWAGLYKDVDNAKYLSLLHFAIEEFSNLKGESLKKDQIKRVTDMIGQG